MVKISNIGEFNFQPESGKLNHMTDVFIGRAGKNLRFRKFRSLIEIQSGATEIGIVLKEEDIASLVEGADTGVNFLTTIGAIFRIKEIAEEKKSAGHNSFGVTLDISCLPRGEQGSIFTAIGEIANSIDVQLGIGYSLSRYSPPPEKWARSITPVEPVHPNFAGWGDPQLPIHVVVGLGYEAGKAFGSVQFLEPSKCTPLMPVSPEERFLGAVKNKNSDFLKRYPNPLYYEVMQPARTYLSLESLLSGTLRDHRAILLPFGPKILFSLSLLAGLVHPEAAIWYVKGEDYLQSDKGSPSGHASLFVCDLTVNTNYAEVSLS